MTDVIEDKMVGITNNNNSDEIFANSSGCPWRQDYLSREANMISRWKEAGLFVEADLNDINCYWLQFEPAPVIYHMALAVLFLVIFFVGSVSNGLVIYITTTSKHLWTPVNIIIVNLAFSDFLMLSCLLLFVYNSMVQGPAIGYQWCEVYGFVSGIAGCVSIMSLAAVATDRYFVITWPERNEEQHKSQIRSYCIVMIIWLYSGAIASMPLFGVGKYVPEGYLTSCSFDYLSDDSTTRFFILIFFVMAWVVPISIIIASYSAVLRFVARNPNLSYRERAIEVMSGASTEEHSHSKHEHRKRRKAVKLEMRIAKTSAILVALWVISWTPYALVSLLGISGFHSLLTPGLAMLPALFAKLSASINPFVYSLNHPKIRKEMERRFHCCCCRSAAAVSGNTSSGNTTSRSRTRHSKRRDSPILHFKSRLASNSNTQKADHSSYDLKEINNYLHRSSQLVDQLHCGLNDPTSGIESRVLQVPSPLVNNHNSNLRGAAGTRRVRLSQSETTCCADVHHQPSSRTRRNIYKRTFQSESNNERRGNEFLREQPILEYLTTIV